MTRQEIIVEAAKKYAGNNEEMRCHFIDGCHWADENPNDEVLKLRKMFESDPDAYKQGSKDVIDKAHVWLMENYDKYVRVIGSSIYFAYFELGRDFRKAMEEQQ